MKKDHSCIDYYCSIKNLKIHNFSRYQVIGENNVAVPTHFFKIIVGEFETTRELEMEAFVLPNEAIPDNVSIHSFQVYYIKFIPK